MGVSASPHESNGVKIGRLQVTALAYVDNMVFLTENMKYLEEGFRAFIRGAEKVTLMVMTIIPKSCICREIKTIGRA